MLSISTIVVSFDGEGLMNLYPFVLNIQRMKLFTFTIMSIVLICSYCLLLGEAVGTGDAIMVWFQIDIYLDSFSLNRPMCKSGTSRHIFLASACLFWHLHILRGTLQDVVFPFNRSIFSRICKIHKRNTSDVASSESEIGSASRFQLVGYSPRKSDLKEKKKFPSMAVKVAMMIKFPLVPPTHHITGAYK